MESWLPEKARRGGLALRKVPTLRSPGPGTGIWYANVFSVLIQRWGRKTKKWTMKGLDFSSGARSSMTSRLIMGHVEQSRCQDELPQNFTNSGVQTSYRAETFTLAGRKLVTAFNVCLVSCLTASENHCASLPLKREFQLPLSIVWFHFDRFEDSLALRCKPNKWGLVCQKKSVVSVHFRLSTGSVHRRWEHVFTKVTAWPIKGSTLQLCVL